MEARLREWNDYFKDLWQKHHFLIVVLMVALMFDTLTTIDFMTRDGIHQELHPLVRYSATMLGPVVGTILSAFVFKMITCVLLALFVKPIRLFVLIVPAITAAFAGCLNLLIPYAVL